MGTPVIHKFYRGLKAGDQFRICDDKKCNMAENVVYRWKGRRKVSCKKCLLKKGTRA